MNGDAVTCFASLQVNFNTLGYEDAAGSVRLFSERVMTRFGSAT